MKKQILTLAVLATIAVGAAVAGATEEFNVKQEADTTPNCKQRQPCHPSDIANCEISGTNYVGSNQPLGSCDGPMELD